MKQVLAGLGLLAGAAIGTVALAPAGGAQTDDNRGWALLDAEFAPDPAQPGDDVTLAPTDETQHCGLDPEEGLIAEGGEVVLYLNGAPETISVEMDDDGMWEVTLEAELFDGPGVYKAVAACRNSVWEEEVGYCEWDDDRLPPGVTKDEEGNFELVSYRRPAAPSWKFDCVSEYYAAELTVEGPGTPTTMPPTQTPPPATPIVAPPSGTG